MTLLLVSRLHNDQVLLVGTIFTRTDPLVVQQTVLGNVLHLHEMALVKCHQAGHRILSHSQCAVHLRLINQTL